MSGRRNLRHCGIGQRSAPTRGVARFPDLRHWAGRLIRPIYKDHIKALPLSSAEFVEKASGIKTRYLIDKKNTLDPNLMRPQVNNEDESRISIHAKAGIEAAKKAIENTNLKISDIDAVIVGTSHAPRNYPAVAIEIQNELGIEGYAYDM